jgi:dephospho-CoA kinase
MTLTVGLTGGIGSGKSAVARHLVALGADLVDTDAIARRLAEPGGAAIGALREAFGPACIDAQGALDRAWMREQAFSDAQVRRQLEAILHPMIGARAQEAAARSRAPMLVFDVPLLVESGRWRSRVDRVLVIDCEEAIQVERVVRRSGWTPAQVRAVIERQAGRAARRACADAVLVNEGTDLEALHTEVGLLLTTWGIVPASAPGQDLS